MRLRILIALLQTLAILEALYVQNRKTWTWNRDKLKVHDIYQYISYEDDFRMVTRMELATFRIMAFKMNDYMTWPKKWYQKYNINITQYDGPKMSAAVSPENRLMRCLMVGAKHKISGLEMLFGQRKSIIYDDFYFICIGVVKSLRAEYLYAPQPGSAEYAQLAGKGALRFFQTAVYIMDVSSFPINRPIRGQRAWYNGYYKQHTQDYLFLHDGDGVVRDMLGPQIGRLNDLNLLYNTNLHRYPERYIQNGHHILSDLMFFYVGNPYLCRIAYQATYNAAEIAYNHSHSEVR